MTESPHLEGQGEAAAIEAEQAPAAPADRVVLYVIRDAGGDRVVPASEGDVRPTEIQTIIELGLKAWCAIQGLGQQPGSR